MDNLKEKFKICKDLTYKVIELLLEFIKWTHKLENKYFNNLTLEQFGLECFYSCKNEINN
jgi:hypothetical protein